MSKKNKDGNQEMSKTPAKGAAPTAAKGAAPTGGNNSGKALTSHGPVAMFDLDRCRKELEKAHIEFKVDKGELFTVDNGDASVRASATKIVSGFRKKAS